MIIPYRNLKPTNVLNEAPRIRNLKPRPSKFSTYEAVDITIFSQNPPRAQFPNTQPSLDPACVGRVLVLSPVTRLARQI